MMILFAIGSFLPEPATIVGRTVMRRARFVKDVSAQALTAQTLAAQALAAQALAAQALAAQALLALARSIAVQIA
jgi:hypothetical protein